ncbi:MAG: hypothetical protein NTZ85_13490 [Bacteroidia bacterium]|nr:hypothetical protein [Bacteroidia bacterium]
MERFILFLAFAFSIFSESGLSGSVSNNCGSGFFQRGAPDTIEKQILFNGRIWRNLYSWVKGDQFLFSNEFLPGRVAIGNKSFDNVSIKYDILNDEILVLSDKGMVVQLNKENIDSFSLNYHNRTFYFKKLGADTLSTLTGYVNVLVEDNVSLYIKYRKSILMLAIDNKYDLFNQFHHIYIRKNGKLYLINSKKDLINLLSENEKQIRNYINSNKLKVSRKIPDSFVPVVKFYNDLQKHK